MATPRKSRDRHAHTPFAKLLAEHPHLAVMLAERGDRLSPAAAGAMVGIVGGPAWLFIAESLASHAALGSVVNALRGVLVDATMRLAPSVFLDVDSTSVSSSSFVNAASAIVPWLFAVVVGGGLGAGFAVLTRYLRKYVPLLLWSLVTLPALWTFVSAFVLVRDNASRVPTLARTMYTPVLFGSLVFGFLLSLTLPLRARVENASQ